MDSVYDLKLMELCLKKKFILRGGGGGGGGNGCLGILLHQVHLIQKKILIDV